MRFMLLIALAGCALRADTITLTESFQTQVQLCCQSFGAGTLQFDPALGTPQSITWTFTDDLHYHGGINDMYQPSGLPFSYSTTEGMRVTVLGVNVSQTQYYSGLTSGNRQISMGGWWSELVLSASGEIAAAGLNTFVGAGEVDMLVSPFLTVDFPANNNGVFAGLDLSQDFITLTMTATYAPVPEPCYCILVLCFASAFLGFRLTSRANEAVKVN